MTNVYLKLWFLLQTSVIGFLRHVLLLYSYHSCYQLSEIRVGYYQEKQGCESYNTCYIDRLRGFWYKAPDVNSISGRMTVSLTISFESYLYGSFDQCVVFDFGKTSYLVQRLNADVQSASLSETSIASQPVIASAIWGERSMEVVRFGHRTGVALRAEHLSRRYSLPEKVKITADHLHRGNYKTVMHQLLFKEEGFMRSEISRYVLCPKILLCFLALIRGFLCLISCSTILLWNRSLLHWATLKVPLMTALTKIYLGWEVWSWTDPWSNPGANHLINSKINARFHD